MLKKNYVSLILLFISINIGSIQKIAQAQTPVTPVTTTKQICPAQLSSAINTIINHINHINHINLISRIINYNINYNTTYRNHKES